MRSLRILLALLIALALPAQALAGVMAAACCPMAEAAASIETAAAHDCCHDEDSQGTPCASDLSCQCGGHPAIGTRAFVPPLPVVFQAHATPLLWAQSVFPVPLWRPPAFI